MNKKDKNNMCHGVDGGRKACPENVAVPCDGPEFPTEDSA